MSLPSMNSLKERLLAISSLRFNSHSDDQTGWQGSGRGKVEVKTKGEVITFHEAGVWENDKQIELKFKNVYRWTFEDKFVRLEHLRFGENHPVLLFSLKAINEAQWESIRPHKCGSDVYTALLQVEKKRITIQWNVKGAKKKATMVYWYE